VRVNDEVTVPDTVLEEVSVGVRVGDDVADGVLVTVEEVVLEPLRVTEAETVLVVDGSVMVTVAACTDDANDSAES